MIQYDIFLFILLINGLTMAKLWLDGATERMLDVTSRTAGVHTILTKHILSTTHSTNKLQLHYCPELDCVTLILSYF